MNRKPAPGPTHILLLTGLPGIGKTTVAEKVAEALQPLPLGGFVTGEIRQGGKRVGFRLRAFGRAPEILAHVDRKSPRRVGRYGVDLEVLERCAEGTLQPDPPRAAYIVDEIGKMECLSRPFVEAMERLFAATLPVVATIARQGGGFIARTKARPGAELWEITWENREDLPQRVLAWLRERLPDHDAP